MASKLATKSKRKIDIQSDDESPPNKKQKFNTNDNDCEFQEGFIPHTEISNMISSIENYYKAHFPFIKGFTYFIIKTVISYLKINANIENIYNELCKSNWIECDLNSGFNNEFYAKYTRISMAYDFMEIPLEIQFETPWLNNANSEFIGLTVLDCKGWRSIKDSFKWQVFLLEQHFPADMREISDESAYDPYDYKTLMDESAFTESGATDEVAMWLFQVKWNWQEDKFVKTFLDLQAGPGDNIENEKYKKHFEKAWGDDF
eukprot:334726_1